MKSTCFQEQNEDLWWYTPPPRKIFLSWCQASDNLSIWVCNSFHTYSSQLTWEELSNFHGHVCWYNQQAFDLPRESMVPSSSFCFHHNMEIYPFLQITTLNKWIKKRAIEILIRVLITIEMLVFRYKVYVQCLGNEGFHF